MSFYLISYFYCRKLQTDLKTTKIDELKQQLEVCFQEIVRLQNSKGTGGQGSGYVYMTSKNCSTLYQYQILSMLILLQKGKLSLSVP